MTDLEIPADIYEQIVAQARAEAPIEACGILAGEHGCATKLYRMTNSDASRDHFMMAPSEQFAVVKDIRASGLQMLAVYHSHPESPARPSEEDIRLALTPGVVYVIVSVMNATSAEIKGFLINDGEVTGVPVTVKQGQEQQ